MKNNNVNVGNSHISNNIEIRSYQTEFRAEEQENSRVIRGLAILVESRSQLLGGEFYETIRSSAVNEDLIKNNDIKLYANHDPSQGTFARSKFGEGSLKLSVTERGLEFETELPDNAYGNYLLDGIRRGDFDSISFGFVIDKDEWTKNEDNTYERSIISFRMIDEISVLAMLPAYSETNVSIRSLEDYKEAEKAEELRKQEIISHLDDKLQEIEEISKY